MPALHISLGTYLKFFNMSEKECKTLAFKIIAKTRLSDEVTAKELQSIIKTYHHIEELQRDIVDSESTIDLIHDAITYQLEKTPENETAIRETYEPRMSHFLEKIKIKVGI